MGRLVSVPRHIFKLVFVRSSWAGLELREPGVLASWRGVDSRTKPSSYGFL